MRKTNPETAEKLGVAIGAPFMVSRHLHLGDTAKNSPHPIKIRDLVIGTAKERGLENRCNAYVLSEVAKDNAYYRDSRRDVLGVAGDSSGWDVSKLPNKQEAYVFTPYEVWETYAVQLYRIED